MRGLDVDPNALRPRLKLAGSQEATVVLARLGTGPEAYVCEAVATGIPDLRPRAVPCPWTHEQARRG